MRISAPRPVNEPLAGLTHHSAAHRKHHGTHERADAAARERVESE